MRRHRLAGVVGVLAALVLSGCAASSNASGSDDATNGTAASAGAFPVEVDHAFGTTVVEKSPERVVTWGWGSADAAIALGVVPVAMPAQSYGGDTEAVLPWVREHLEEQGEELPEVLPDTEAPPLEAIAAAQPDVILAPYSGITESQYDLLSQIAPTVAYPGEPWATPWRDTIRITGSALGLADEAERLLGDIDDRVAEVAAEHPELAGTSVAVTFPTPGGFYVYKPADARVGFLLDMGMTSAPSVEQLANGDETFFYTLSPERLDELTSDVLVVYADTAKAAEQFLDSPGAKLMPQVRDGRVATVVGPEKIAAVSPPTALSLTWGLEDYAAELARATKAGN